LKSRLQGELPSVPDYSPVSLIGVLCELLVEQQSQLLLKVSMSHSIVGLLDVNYQLFVGLLYLSVRSSVVDVEEIKSDEVFPHFIR
jgi:hypothetical protein